MTNPILSTPSLSDSLAAAPVAVASLARDPHEEAKARVGTAVRGWRLVRLLGVGPLTAAFEVTRGAASSLERGTMKILLGSVPNSEPVRAEFVRSAYAANRFHHARVVPTLLDGTDDQHAPFVVRSWTDAEPLDAWLAKNETPSELELLRIASQVLDILEMANAHGITHGAISPQNIFVTLRRTARLCDFASSPGLGFSSDQNEGLLWRLRVGPYTAPERCIGSVNPEPLPGEQADVYSLAACLFFAMTKTYPRGGARTPEELAITPARPLRQLAPHAGEMLAKVIDHALEGDPRRRYPSAYAMLGDVRRVLAGRKPKLGAAQRPVPTGSYREMPFTRSGQRQTETGRFEPAREGTGTSGPAVAADGFRGNVVLILAIAFLVGIATFVIVREKMDDARVVPRAGTSTAH